MSRKAFKVWNGDRTLKKSFCSSTDISEVIKIANEKGLCGTRIVLEEDGTEVEDSETLECFSDKVLMILDENSAWSPHNVSDLQSPPPKPSFDILYLNSAPIEDNSMHNISLTTSAALDNSYTPRTNSLSDTLSMSSGAISESSEETSVGLNQSKILFSKFKIDWMKVPSHIMTILKREEPLQSCYFNGFIHFVVNEMRTIAFYIPIPVMRKVAEDIMSEYPKSFGVINQKGQLNTEPINLTAKLQYHNNYLNRKEKRRSTLEGLSPKVLKKVKSLQEGCPNLFRNSEEDEESLERKRLFLKENCQLRNLKQSEVDKIDSFFNETYSMQRQFLNNFENPPTIEEIEQKWPHLLQVKYARIHFSKLINATVDMEANLKESANTIVTFVKKRLRGGQFINKCDNLEHETIAAISFYFAETLDLVFKSFPMGTTVENVEPPCNSPWIAAIGKLNFR